MPRPRWTSRDLDYLGQSLVLAARGGGQTSPNPMVGALLVRRGKVVGRGYHTRAGAPHAEVVALAQAGRRAGGASLYVNLEPCCHHGRTPPCADAIIAAGVSEVVACMRDPDARVNGKGFAALRAAGMTVRVGALRRAAERLNERFLRHARSGRPFVTLKAGMSLDGRIATREGESKWITSARARALARGLRGEHDAVLVGVGTVLADNPALAATAGRSTAGRVARTGVVRGPVRVVLDGRLRTPPKAHILGNGREEVVIVTLAGASPIRRRQLERAGALVIEVRGRNGRVGLKQALAELGRRGVTSVLIEGGGEVLGSALDERIGDRVVLFVSGRLIGGRAARPAFSGTGVARLGEAAKVKDLTVRPIGPDLLVEGRLGFPRTRRDE